MIEPTIADSVINVQKDFLDLPTKGKVENGFYITIMMGGPHNQISKIMDDIKSIPKLQEDSKKLQNLKEWLSNELVMSKEEESAWRKILNEGDSKK